jgi:hypothetical protein
MTDKEEKSDLEFRKMMFTRLMDGPPDAPPTDWRAKDYARPSWLDKRRKGAPGVVVGIFIVAISIFAARGIVDLANWILGR